jgi:hypothetical protein
MLRQGCASLALSRQFFTSFCAASCSQTFRQKPDRLFRMNYRIKTSATEAFAKFALEKVRSI